jgi:hypothetical protein
MVSRSAAVTAMALISLTVVIGLAMRRSCCDGLGESAPRLASTSTAR